MPLFSLSDVTFQNKDSRGPLSSLVSSPFQNNLYRYPNDLGSSYDKGHYMVIYARVQEKSSYATSSSGINAPSGDILAKTTGSTLSDVMGIPAASSLGNVKNISGSSFIRKTKMTTDSIALYMPDTLLYAYNQTYADVSLTDTLAGQVAAAGVSFMEAQQGYKQKVSTFMSSMLKSAGITLAKNAIGGGITPAAIYAGLGIVENPMLELIYRNPNFRTFQFDFMFYPRDESEAKGVQKIIERLRFHQAPEISSPGGANQYAFLVPPSEFEIRFYYNGQQNPNIPPIGTVVLESINLNYAPNGFSAYESYGQNSPSLGGTGMPVAIQMTLQFKEITYLTKSDFDSGQGVGIGSGITQDQARTSQDAVYYNDELPSG